MISLLSFLFAGTSFLNELNLAQALTASLGGTAVRFQTTFGLFTFFLGLGALIFDHLKTESNIKKILIYSQVGMVFVGLFGPYWIKFLDPISRPDHQLFFTILSYLPICICGLISGLELPALISVENKLEINKFKALAWDYIGMFVVSLAFPLWLLYSFGVLGISKITTILSLVGLILILKSNLQFKTQAPIENLKTTSAQKYSKVALLLFFTLSLCSFAYELLLAKLLSDIFNDETMAYSLGIGFLLLGLGFGAVYAERIKKPLESLITTEILIISICSVLFVFIHGLAGLIYASPNLKFITDFKIISFLLFSPFPFVIGFLTGLELPLLLKLFPSVKDVGLPISLNYTGALVAGFLTPFLLLPIFGTSQSLQVICCINIVAASILIYMQKNFVKPSTLLLPIIILVLFIPVKKYNTYAEQLFLKTYYYQLSLDSYTYTSLRNYFNILKVIPDVHRTTSVYQNIDIIKKYDHPFFGNKGNSLYLNKQPQFDSTNWKTYHQSMALGGFNLSQSIPKNVLICGGGDGILARLLAENPNVEKITLVELDSKIIEMAKSNLEFIDINKRSLSHPKVNVIINDAYSFLKQSNNKYDAIFLDFPYPDNFDLSRLYSLELYKTVLKNLSPNGFIVMDAPLQRHLNKSSNFVSDQKILEKTVLAAGFKAVFSFGSIEPFIYASQVNQELKFRYEDLPNNLPNRTFVNLLKLDLPAEDENKVAPINTMFLPVRFFKNE